MADNLLHFGLSSAFTSRIRQYLFLLEVTNHTELVCIICDFLTTPELINLLGTSRHFLSLQKVQSIELRILRAKLDFYEKPRVQPSFPSMLLSCLPVQIGGEVPVRRSQKIKKQHEALKIFNQKIRYYNKLKKAGMTENKETFQKLQKKSDHLELPHPQHLTLLNHPMQAANASGAPISATHNNIKSSGPTHLNGAKINNSTASSPKEQATMTKTIGRQRVVEYNPLISRFHEIQYKLAKEDYENRKRKRMIQQNQRNLLSLEELRKLAETDPCSRQVYLRVYEEEKAKIQRENVSRLRMKTFRTNAEQVSTEVLGAEKVKKVAVVKQSIAGKLLSNIKQFIWKERKTVSI